MPDAPYVIKTFGDRQEMRAPCINPNCGRTWKYEGCEVVCNKCMKLCPKERARYRWLRRRYNHLRRYPQKWSEAKVNQLFDLMDKNWAALKRKLHNPGGPPADFGEFKKEMGWDANQS